MVKEDSNFNIFDPSSHKKEIKKKDPSPIFEESKEKYKDLDIDDMLNRMKEMKSNLDRQIEEAFDRGKISTHRIQEVLKGLEENKLSSIKKEKKKFENEVFSALGEQSRKEHLEKEQEKEDKVRKGKTLGARRKWMPMK